MDYKYEEGIIRLKAWRMAKKTGMSKPDRDDLEGDLWLHLQRRRGQYDPNRGAYSTYVDRVITNELHTIGRRKCAEKRTSKREAFSLQEETFDSKGKVSRRSDAIEDSSTLRPDALGFAFDLKDFLERLTETEQQVLLARLSDQSHRSISRELGISQRQVKNAVARIEQLAREHELHEYLGRERATSASQCVSHR